jgi:hypothetical protein
LCSRRMVAVRVISVQFDIPLLFLMSMWGIAARL